MISYKAYDIEVNHIFQQRMPSYERRPHINEEAWEQRWNDARAFFI